MTPSSVDCTAASAMILIMVGFGGERNQQLDEFNIDIEYKLEVELKKTQTLQNENRHMKETLRQGDIALIERETAIV